MAATAARPVRKFYANGISTKPNFHMADIIGHEHSLDTSHRNSVGATSFLTNIPQSYISSNVGPTLPLPPPPPRSISPFSSCTGPSPQMTSRRESMTNKILYSYVTAASQQSFSEIQETPRTPFNRRFQTLPEDQEINGNIKQSYGSSNEINVDSFGQLPSIPQTSRRANKSQIGSQFGSQSAIPPLFYADSSKREIISKPNKHQNSVPEIIIKMPVQIIQRRARLDLSDSQQMMLRRLNKKQMCQIDFLDSLRKEEAQVAAGGAGVQIAEFESPIKVKVQKSSAYMDQFNAELARYSSQINEWDHVDDFTLNDTSGKDSDRLLRSANKFIRTGRIMNARQSLTLKQNAQEHLSQLDIKKDIQQLELEQNARVEAKEIAHTIFLQDFCHKFSEFLAIANSRNRAEKMIQTIKGFSPLIKNFLFINGHLRTELTPALLKDLIRIFKANEKKGESAGQINPSQLGYSIRLRRIGIPGGFGSKQAEDYESQDIQKDLEYFHKYFSAWVDEKSKMKAQELDKEAVNEFGGIQDILLKHSFIGNEAQRKYKEICFKEIQVNADKGENEASSRAPYFIQPNQTIKNLDYWEKRLGKFAFISNHVRNTEAQIASLCKNYMALSSETPNVMR